MRRLDLLRRAPDYRSLFLATFGSGVGTFLAAIALQIDILERTGSGKWMSALLVAEFVPMILVGLLLGPLVDRLSRRGLMVASDLVRVVIFCLLPFAGSPAVVVVLAFAASVATGFFRPAVYAGLPNLVEDDDLTEANSLLQSAENIAWMLGPVLGAALITAQSDNPDLAYAINAATFLVSALLLVRIPARLLQAGAIESRGHWRDIGDGLRIVLGTRALALVLVVWNVVLLGTAAINVGEIFLAKVSLDASTFGFGILVGASGLGLTLGSLAASPLLERVGVRSAYSVAIGLMAAGFGLAAVAPHLAVAVVGVVAGTIGNGAAVVCNALLVQRGAPDELRGRAFTVIMSTNYVVLGLGMVAAGPLVDVFGARWLWGGASAAFFLAAATAFLLARGVEAPVAEGKLEEPVPSRV